MARGKRKKWRQALLKRALGFTLGALLGGLAAVFLTVFLGHFIPRRFATPLGVGLAVGLSFWVLQRLKLQAKMFARIPFWVAGLFAGIGVQVATTWVKHSI